MGRHTMPRDVYFGANALENLKALKGKKKAVIISGGSSMKKYGFIDKTKALLEEVGISVHLIDGIEPDPSVETVMEGSKTMLDLNPDVIIGIGGGSSIDAAKAMWVFYEHPELEFDDVKEAFSIPKLRNKAIFVAIPSTSGTATEVTSAAVVTDYKKKVKYPLVSTELVPDIAIVDTDMPQTLPPHLVAHTGMDALTHAVEAYIAINRSAITDGLSKQSIEKIYDHLVLSFNGSKESRGEMHIAQCLAGMAFSNAGLGIAHSMAHQIGVQCGISHGCCNAILLPYVVEFNSKVSEKDFADLARMLGLPGNTDKQLVASFVDSIKDLNKRLNIDQAIKDYDVDEKEFLDALDYMAENAIKDGNTPTNPRKTTANDIKEILKCAFYGKQVTF